MRRSTLLVCVCLLVVGQIAADAYAQRRGGGRQGPGANGGGRGGGGRDGGGGRGGGGPGGGGGDPAQLDQTIREGLQRANVTPLQLLAQPTLPQVELGQALFFDNVLSGNRDTSCATCHHPKLATGDAVSLSVGTGTSTLGAIGADRFLGEGRQFIPRHAPNVFNRGVAGWRSAFWDSRISDGRNGQIRSPVGRDLPQGLDSVLAAQALFPLLSREEMRGSVEDGENPDLSNELASVADDDVQAVWQAVMDRLLANEQYQALFATSYPNTPGNQIGIQHVGNAIASFQEVAFTFTDSPFDQYVAGDNNALTPLQKQGAALFFGRAGCARCHNGPLLTNQRHHNIGVPQLGPGAVDAGRFLQTGDDADLYDFRTAPLRNVAESGPWMHNGAFNSLTDVVRHYSNPAGSLRNYDPDRSLDDESLRDTVVTDPAVIDDIVNRLDVRPARLNNNEIAAVVAFLQSLSAPNVSDRLLNTIPASVPSGLPIDGAE